MLQMNREIQRRHEWLADSMRRAQRRLGLTQPQMAAEMNMSRSTYQDRLRDPGHMSLYEVWRLEAVLKHAGLLEEAAALGNASRPLSRLTAAS